jgi:hypothetical protein
MNPEDDSSSIGRILTSMGLVTDAQIAEAAQEQKQLSAEQKLGMLLVSKGLVSLSDLNRALDAQESLRSKSRYKQAMALVSIAQAGQETLRGMTQRINNKIVQARSQSSGNYPIILDAMLDKNKA